MKNAVMLKDKSKGKRAVETAGPVLATPSEKSPRREREDNDHETA